MVNITLTDAVTFVRSRIDELAEQNDMLADESLDDRNLSLTVNNLLPEALNTIAMSAPADMLDGDDIPSTSYNVSTLDGVVTIKITAYPFLRLAALKVGVSEVTVVDTYGESSVVGRMQLNKYLRGTTDNPVVIMTQGTDNNAVELKYYSVGTGASAAIRTFKAIRRCVAGDFNNNGNATYPKRLREIALTYLVGLVLQTYKENDFATLFFTRATDMLKIF